MPYAQPPHDAARRPRLVLCLVAILSTALLLTASAVLAAPEKAKASSQPATAGAPADLNVPESGVAEPTPSKLSPRPRLSPMIIEMRAVLDAERVELEALRARFAAASSPAAALEIQRSIDKRKADTEIALLRIQANHARKAGRLQMADRIDAVIEELLAPPRRLQPIPRPAPGDVTKASAR